MICGALYGHRKRVHVTPLRVTVSGFGASLCGGGLCWGARRRDCSLLAVEFHGLNSRDFVDRNLVFLHMNLILYVTGI